EHTDWTPERLTDAETRLALWDEWSRYAGSARYSTNGSDDGSTNGEESRRSSAALRLSKGSSRSERIETSGGLLAELRAALADDLDAPAAIRAIDTHIAAGATPTRIDLDAIDALLGIRL